MRTPLSTRFGLLVAGHRKRLGMTQRALSEKVGLSEHMISKIESGASGVRFPVIERLSEALGVDPAELFSAEFPRGRLHKPELAELMARLAKLSDADFAWAKGVIDATLRTK